MPAITQYVEPETVIKRQRAEIARFTAELAAAKERERVLRDAVEKFMVYFTSANGVPVERATVRANSAAVRAGRAALGEP